MHAAHCTLPEEHLIGLAQVVAPSGWLAYRPFRCRPMINTSSPSRTSLIETPPPYPPALLL
jgi:hypothetical protein